MRRGVALPRAAIVGVLALGWEITARSMDPLLYVPPSRVLPAKASIFGVMTRLP